MSGDIRKVVIKFGQLKKIDDLQTIVDNVDEDELLEACGKSVRESNINTFFDYLLQGFTDTSESKDKRFNAVSHVLKLLNSEELNIKSTFDLVTRICMDLALYPHDQLVRFIEDALDSIRKDDSKTVYWKDFLPPVLGILFNISELSVNAIQMTGQEYRSAVIKNITLFRWRQEILTPLASMFKEIDMTKEEREQILVKLSESLFDLEPKELPGLALQMFGLCNSPPLLVIPILFFQRYFNKYFYTKQYENVESNTTYHSSIDPQLTNAQDLQEAQDTILYHLSTSTEFKLTEKDVVTVFRSLSNTPHYLLTPFMISALLTLSKVNRQPDVVRLSSSPILPFLRKVIENNEHEKQMGHESLWCRQTFNRNTVAFDHVVDILINQSITSMEVVTPGLIALAFTLLKAKKQSDLNSLGIKFLHQFLKKRYQFAKGIIKQLSELLFANQEAGQFSQCLNSLSLAHSFTISECTVTLHSFLDFMLMIPGHHAMRMIGSVYPLIKYNPSIKENLIETLTKAMASTDVHRRRFGVYGFCLFLKNLQNNLSRRAVAGGNLTSSTYASFTQGNISGFSLMSQSTFGNRDNPDKNFDMLTMEIIGLLRKCFNETEETKDILYEGLSRAMEFNQKLIPHLLTFIDWHFRSYFERSGGELVVHFAKIVTEDCAGEVDVWDDIGKLVTFVATCVVDCEQHQISYDTRLLVDLLNTILEKVTTISVQSLELENNRKSKEIGRQLIHLMEGIMAYAALANGQNMQKQLFDVFKHHQNIMGDLKTLFSAKKTAKKSKKDTTSTNPNNSSSLSQATTEMSYNETQETLNETPFKAENIWRPATVAKLLEWVFGESSSDQLQDFHEDVQFKSYLLKVTTTQIESLRSAPDYRLVKHSHRMYSFLCDVTKYLFASLKDLQKTGDENDVSVVSLIMECFYQCLVTAESVYKRKLETFFTDILTGDTSLCGHIYHEQILVIVAQIHSLVEIALEDNLFRIGSPVEAKKIHQNLINCLDILYGLLPPEHIECAAVATWLYDFCQKNSIDGRHFDGIFKCLFAQRRKYYDGDFFSAIAIQISRIFGQLSASVECGQSAVELKAITEITAETALQQLCGVLRRDIEDVEVTLQKAKSQTAKVKFLGEKGANDEHVQSLKTMERAICTHMIHIGTSLLHLANTKIPHGCTDLLFRLLTQFYVCLNNVAKHLIARHCVIPVVYAHIQFDKLIQLSGKPVAGRVYELITHVDRNLLSDENESPEKSGSSSGKAKKKEVSPEKSKKKVIRETRSVPKLIRFLEMLHKHILLLGKKTAKDLSPYLHMGIVRDFRITDLTVSDDDDEDNENRNGEEDGDESNGEESDSVDIVNVSGTATEKILKNMAKIRKKKASTDKDSKAMKPPSAPGVRGKRSRSTVKVPDVTAILSAVNANLAQKEPLNKRPRRSK